MEPLRRTIEAWDPDVIHLEFAVSVFGARLPALFALLRELRPLRAELVVTLHEVTRDTQSLRGLGRAIYCRLTELCDRAVVHTEASLSVITQITGTPVALIPHPRAELPAATATPTELRARHGLGDARVLLAFGFIHVDKGLDDLVTALRLVPGDVRLVVAGDVRERQSVFRFFELRDRLHLRRVRQLIDRYGLDDRVVFTGYVPAGEVRPWFELAEAAVLPYTRIEQSGEPGRRSGSADAREPGRRPGARGHRHALDLPRAGRRRARRDGGGLPGLRRRRVGRGGTRAVRGGGADPAALRRGARCRVRLISAS
jgi:glycosyltransferase involved in cell wall biosynthesis